MDTRQVNITYHREDGVWWAESDDMPGFSAAGDTFAETRKNVWEGVDFYFNDNQPTSIIEYTDDGAKILSDNIVLFNPGPKADVTIPTQRPLSTRVASVETKTRKVVAA
ncbi:hypothetical protein BISA_0881 [Bifidobacterium saguini DSM 23967]|uniref:DUF1902 domain-containing protein n=2 Tax=Bifidobacterium saguini TaxID=762210 RepID=A0A087DAC9_9BIFI|nr:type II toxin-antitoxin system HicB family antitoxin [Bifidobacterium saguini]KFI92479.1 hypothetical protein BISA_0881 [Bifidobacterium saguini DSM 23967]QTB90797.1 type II toxin-antitoxin system HicB family antitoxin [Bifidobacterium saguini]QTB90859.1 type II toxin-antitoxin system HicB family antitoxin [Bifidobacterium saguini]